MHSDSSNSPVLHSCRPSRFRPCSVCSGPSNGFYFGVLSCRACASFFRRSALEGRQYACRKADNCCIQIDGMRNSCRACRLRRCVQAGMCMESQAFDSNQGSSTPENVLPVSYSESGSSADTSKLQLHICLDMSTPAVHFLQQTLRNMQNSYRALINVISKRNLCLNERDELHPIVLEEHLQFQRGEVTLLLTLVREYFPEMDSLPNETKVRLLKYFAFQLGFMNRAEMTIQAFPCVTSGLTKLVLHPGFFVDRDKLDYFFSSLGDEAAIRKNNTHCGAILEKTCRMITERYKPLAIAPLEFTALIGIQFWNSVERFVPLSPAMNAKRDQLYAELHALIAQRMGPDSAAIGIRYGQLLGLVHEITAYIWEMEEIFTVLKLFMPLQGCDLWEDLLTGKQDLDRLEEKADLEKTVIRSVE